MKNKRLHNRVKSYLSLIAAAGLSSSNGFGSEIIVTDVNYSGGYENYDIDIDGNGVTDFSIMASNSTTSFYGFNISVDNISLFKGENTNNLIQGVNVTSSNGYLTSNVISNLNSGNYVYSSVPLLDFGVLAGIRVVSGTFSSFPFTQSNNLGYFGDGTKHYVGVQFDIDGNDHYGWLRFDDITSDGSAWTLVDMAYYSDPRGIFTGQTVGVDDINTSSTSVFTSNNSLIISTDMRQAQIEVFDINGKVIFTESISSSNNQIPYDLPKGIYIVRLFNKEKAITRKISL